MLFLLCVFVLLYFLVVYCSHDYVSSCCVFVFPSYCYYSSWFSCVLLLVFSVYVVMCFFFVSLIFVIMFVFHMCTTVPRITTMFRSPLIFVYVPHPCYFLLQFIVIVSCRLHIRICFWSNDFCFSCIIHSELYRHWANISTLILK